MDIIQFLPLVAQITICSYFVWQNYKLKKENSAVRWMLCHMPIEDLEKIRKEKPENIHLSVVSVKEKP